MIPTRGIRIYVKFSFLMASVALFYWRDFGAFLQTILSTTWIGGLIILVLSGVFLLQRRRALKALVSRSENNSRRGALYFALALVIYVIGSYTPYALWLHLCSLVLFVVSYLTLVIDFQIPRVMFPVFLAYLFIIPPMEIQNLTVQNLLLLVAFYFAVDMFILILVLFIIKASRMWKRVTHLAQKQSRSVKREVDVASYFPPKHESTKFVLAIFLMLLLIPLSLISVPSFSLENREAYVTQYTPYGMEKQFILPALQDWDLESSERLVDYEKERFEDFALLATYISGVSENKSNVLLEIGPAKTYMMNEWKLPGWEKPSPRRVLLAGYQATYVSLQKENSTISVLYWRMRLPFRAGSVYLSRSLGVSVFRNQTKLLTALEKEEFLKQSSDMGISIISWWNSVNLWTLHALTLLEFYVLFKDVLITAAAVVSLLLFARWVRKKDEKMYRLTENALILLDNEESLLTTVSSFARRRFWTLELFQAYKNTVQFNVDMNEFNKKMDKLSKLGLVERKLVLEDGDLQMVWERKLF